MYLPLRQSVYSVYVHLQNGKATDQWQIQYIFFLCPLNDEMYIL